MYKDTDLASLSNFFTFTLAYSHCSGVVLTFFQFSAMPIVVLLEQLANLCRVLLFDWHSKHGTQDWRIVMMINAGDVLYDYISLKYYINKLKSTT